MGDQEESNNGYEPGSYERRAREHGELCFSIGARSIARRAGEHCQENKKIRWPKVGTDDFRVVLHAKISEEVAELYDAAHDAAYDCDYDKVYEEAADVIITVMSAIASIRPESAGKLAKAIVDKIKYNEQREDHKGPKEEVAEESCLAGIDLSTDVITDHWKTQAERKSWRCQYCSKQLPDGHLVVEDSDTWICKECKVRDDEKKIVDEALSVHRLGKGSSNSLLSNVRLVMSDEAVSDWQAELKEEPAKKEELLPMCRLCGCSFSKGTGCKDDKLCSSCTHWHNTCDENELMKVRMYEDAMCCQCRAKNSMMRDYYSYGKYCVWCLPLHESNDYVRYLYFPRRDIKMIPPVLDMRTGEVRTLDGATLREAPPDWEEPENPRIKQEELPYMCLYCGETALDDYAACAECWDQTKGMRTDQIDALMISPVVCQECKLVKHMLFDPETKGKYCSECLPPGASLSSCRTIRKICYPLRVDQLPNIYINTDTREIFSYEHGIKKTRRKGASN